MKNHNVELAKPVNVSIVCAGKLPNRVVYVFSEKTTIIGMLQWALSI